MGQRKPDSRTAKPDRSRLERRRRIVGIICVCWFGCVAARLYYLQIIQYTELLSRAEHQQQRTIEVAPQRGAIYDRQMNPLAMSLAVDSVYAVPKEFTDPQMVASLLAPVLEIDTQELRDKFASAHSFCWVKRRIKPQEATRVRELNLKGIYFQPETKRFYPNGILAAQTVGYVGLDGTGLGGIEWAREDEVKGEPGRVLLDSDARQHTFSSTEWPGTPGKNIVLTLDEKIQYIAEKALADEVASAHAAGGTAIVQNPNTGEILAIANQPTFNPNDYNSSNAVSRVNRAVGWIYEPGSTFKLITVAAAIEEKLTNPDEIIDCQGGKILLAGHTIHDAEPNYVLSITDMFARSSDVGAVKLALRLGDDRLYRYIKQFGIGSKTGVELPGEERGLLRPPSRWSGLSIGEMAIGQEAGVTPLQMVTMYSSIANGGILFEPRVIHDVYIGNQHEPLSPATGHRVLTERTAETMRKMLSVVVDSGTGKAAQLAGYTSAGKTGTAQKIDANGTYNHFLHIGSFVGFAPATNPAVTILVVIDSPVGAYYGADVAAPVFRSIAEQTLSYLNVPQDNPSRWPSTVPPKSPRAPGQKQEDLMGFLSPDRDNLGTATPAVQPASYSTQSVPYGPMPVSLRSGGMGAGTQSMGDTPLVTIPDLSGLATRQVAQKCQKLGLDLNLVGSGLVVEQNPVAGSRVSAGTRIWVKLAR